MIRSSWLFRKTPLNYAFHFLFPFHEATGRHRFSLWGVVKCFLYAFLRPVWKLLPSPIREFAHILLREPGRLLRRPRPAAQARKGKAERSQPFRQWFTDNAKAGHRVICSTDLLPAISNAFGYGYFIARKKWRYIDLDFEWLILDRRELAKIPPSALRVAFANIKLAYRDDHFIALANHKTEPDINDRPWSELDGILTRNAMVEESDVIAILNVWKRGPGLLRRQILGLLDQSYAPREIWICAFGLDDADIYENVAREFSRNGVYFFKSSKNLKYHGRFQIALQADAEYVAFIDDDIIIGRDFLKRCRETMLVTPDAGEVGIYGWRALPAPNNMNGKDAKNYTEGEFIEHLPPERKNIGLVEVDLLCGYHFVRADCLQTLFRTQQWTYSTGEDFQLAFALRKYANKKSYVVPIDPENPNSWGLSADWRELRDHATTIGDMDAVRDALYWRLLNEGNAVNWMKQTPANIKCVYLMYRDFSEAKAVAKAAAEAGETVSDTTRVIGLYCGEDPELAPSAASALSADGAPKFHAYSALNLNLEELNSLKGKSAGRSAELIYALSGLWQALPPRGVYLPREAEELSAVAKIVLQDLKAAVDICAIESPRRFKAEQNRTAASLSSLSAERFERRP
jgi:glycosyltransferase involved in cell wall biosynthesis